MIRIERCNLALVPSARHWMLTIGNPERRALRITRGNLDRHGRWHPWRPDVFWIVDGRRVGLRDGTHE